MVQYNITNYFILAIKILRMQYNASHDTVMQDLERTASDVVRRTTYNVKDRLSGPVILSYK